MIPCRISVYETSDGEVIISRMNTDLISKVFSGTVTEVMTRATAGNEKMLSELEKVEGIENISLTMQEVLLEV